MKPKRRSLSLRHLLVGATAETLSIVLLSAAAQAEPMQPEFIPSKALDSMTLTANSPDQTGQASATNAQNSATVADVGSSQLSPITAPADHHSAPTQAASTPKSPSTVQVEESNVRE